MAKKRPLKEGEKRCPQCDAIIKDKLYTIPDINTLGEVVGLANGNLTSVRWLFVTSLKGDRFFTLLKLVHRRRRNEKMKDDKWIEAEFIADAASAVITLKNFKNYCLEHPRDTLSRVAFEYHKTKAEVEEDK